MRPAESMTLRFPAHFQQLLFTWGFVIALAATALGQGVAEISIGGQWSRMTILGVSGAALMVKGDFGEKVVPLTQVTEIRMAAPAELQQGFQAYQAKDYPKALGFFRTLTDRYRGLPVGWAQQAAAMVVEVYLAMNDLTKAESEYTAFTRSYPNGATAQSEVQAARIAVSKKNFAAAKQKLAPITDSALKEKAINPANALAYSQAFLASGQVRESEGTFGAALEDYLRTVTLFYHDRAAVAVAQERADALRREHPEVTVP